MGKVESFTLIHLQKSGMSLSKSNCRMDEWMDGRMDGGMDGWMDGENALASFMST